MRLVGTSAFGIRLPILGAGEDLVTIVADNVVKTIEQQGKPLTETDIIAVTESMVAKAEKNFASIADIAADVRTKFPSGEVGLVYPMTSRNRFLNILKGIADGVDKLHILLSFPHDEVGNPVMDLENLDTVEDFINERIAQNKPALIPASEFRAIAGAYKMPFTGVDYVALYESIGKHISIYFSNDPRAILEKTPHIIVGEIHSRNRTKKRLQKAGAQTVHTLSDILNKSVNGSGFNKEYGVLGSNLSTETTLKLFPNDAQGFATRLQARLHEKTGTTCEVMVYGDGAFKDPVCGIWELADPVVSPGYTPRLGGQPEEIKIKFVADTKLAHMNTKEKEATLAKMIHEKANNPTQFREGTTPRIYADLLGSLADLVSGSGDKGTPVVLIRGYFDNYTSQ
ncbi:MAG: coenzyme F420-0:L-glutamate ligase [Defluviitaleaceae bacterium]|nr:coenzyme F420-0:L-glutamate ligase [Defluviitaleaceae bacterium]MCL2273498.1 coenzyme F420-0:L-glutamate ligase [Defluviitaleaceae bacterium]